MKARMMALVVVVLAVVVGIVVEGRREVVVFGQ